MSTQLSKSAADTERIARAWATGCGPGLRIALCGDLGAGKTTFAKGVISQLTGISPDEIPSPTFTLIEEYTGDFPIYHVDLYRISTEKEANDLAWDELLSPQALTLIEWPERLPARLRDCQIEVRFSRTEEGSGRILEFLEKDSS